MANIKSAKKRILVNEKKRLRNKSIKSATKTAVKKLYASVAAEDRSVSQAAFVLAVSAIDRAASKGVFHRNTASRKQSKLARMMSKAAL